jgi:hygromycin-B 7''-O-kinase
MQHDFYIQPDAPDSVLDTDTVLSIARRHVPSARGLEAVDENGGEARTYMIDDDLVLKVQRPQQLRPRTSLKKERFYLQQLEGVQGVNVPRVLGGGVAGPNIEYTVLTRMPGVAIEFADLEGAPRQQALFDLGRMLRRIHAIPQQPLFESRLIPGDHTPADVRWRFGNLFDAAVDAIAKSSSVWTLAQNPTQVMRLAMQALPDVDTWIALHSNPGPEHVFVDAVGKQLSGIIDFGDAYFNHPVHDLRRFRCPHDRASVYAGYTANAPVGDNFARTWDVACALADMLAAVHNPECRAAAFAELALLVQKFGG